MCALRCQLTVRIEGGTRDQHQAHQLEPSLFFVRPLHVISSNPTHFKSFNNCPLILVLSVDIKKSLVVYLLELGCQFGKRLDCIISNCQANACLCVCMCVSHMSPLVSHQVGSHTQLAPHSSTELHTGKERVPGVDVLYSFRRSLPLNALVASHTCIMHQQLHRTKTR